MSLERPGLGDGPPRRPEHGHALPRPPAIAARSTTGRSRPPDRRPAPRGVPLAGQGPRPGPRRQGPARRRSSSGPGVDPPERQGAVDRGLLGVGRRPQKDFVWVTGTWRVPPPGPVLGQRLLEARRPGLVSRPRLLERPQDRPDRLPQGRPARRPPGRRARRRRPAPDYFYVPGQYAPDGDGVVWKPGFWAKAQPGWSWVPAQWVQPARRLDLPGRLLGPHPRRPRHPLRPGPGRPTRPDAANTVYQPLSQVSPESYGLLYGAFGRPNSYYDGYPGCYYDPNGRYYGYAQYGIVGPYYGYLDYPYSGTYGYPYLTTSRPRLRRRLRRIRRATAAMAATGMAAMAATADMVATADMAAMAATADMAWARRVRPRLRRLWPRASAIGGFGLRRIRLRLATGSAASASAGSASASAIGVLRRLRLRRLRLRRLRRLRPIRLRRLRRLRPALPVLPGGRGGRFANNGNINNSFNRTTNGDQPDGQQRRGQSRRATNIAANGMNRGGDGNRRGRLVRGRHQRGRCAPPPRRGLRQPVPRRQSRGRRREPRRRPGRLGRHRPASTAAISNHVASRPSVRARRSTAGAAHAFGHPAGAAGNPVGARRRHQPRRERRSTAAAWRDRRGNGDPANGAAPRSCRAAGGQSRRAPARRRA